MPKFDVNTEITLGTIVIFIALLVSVMMSKVTVEPMELKLIDKGYPYYSPEIVLPVAGCKKNNLYKNKFDYFYILLDNDSSFDRETYQNNHPKEYLCVKPGADPGERVVYLFTSKQLDKEHFVRK